MDRFFECFVLPLVSGGKLRVGRPLGAEELSSLVADATSGGGAQIETEIDRFVAQRWLYPLRVFLDQDLVTLAVALHNILFLSHPDAEGWRVGQGGKRKLAAFVENCLSLEAPQNHAQLLGRHALLHNLFNIGRVDVEYRYWAGRRRYVGTTPGRHMLVWPRLRRISQRQEKVVWIASDLTATQRKLVEQLLWQSPLTALLNPLRGFPDFGFAGTVPFLVDKQVARTVCQRYLTLGLSAVGPVLARAFWGYVENGKGVNPQYRAWVVKASGAWGAKHPLGLLVGLIQYLCVARFWSYEDGLGLDQREDHNDSLATVLVVAEECGLAVDARAIGDEQIAARYARFVQKKRRALGGAIATFAAKLQARLLAPGHAG